MRDEVGAEGTGGTGAPRLVTVNRAQVQLRSLDLESLLPADHRARAIWMVVEQLDLGRFYAAIEARGSEPGRPAIDPKLLVALWLYGTSEGVGSARELARLGEQHGADRWLWGGWRAPWRSCPPPGRPSARRRRRKRGSPRQIPRRG